MATSDDTRSPSFLSMVMVGVLVVVGAWLAIGLLSATLRAAIAFAGYIIVGFVAYHIGKFAGRHSDEP
jgi:hypothetical protein